MAGSRDLEGDEQPGLGNVPGGPSVDPGDDREGQPNNSAASPAAAPPSPDANQSEEGQPSNLEGAAATGRATPTPARPVGQPVPAASPAAAAFASIGKAAPRPEIRRPMGRPVPTASPAAAAAAASPAPAIHSSKASEKGMFAAHSRKEVTHKVTLQSSTPGVGKRSLYAQFKQDPDAQNRYAYGFDSANFELEGKQVRLNTRFTDPELKKRASHLPRAEILVIVYDLTDRDSFEEARKSLADIDTSIEGVFTLVGTKADLEHREVPYEEIRKLSDELKRSYPHRFVGCYETSAVTGKNVHNVFTESVKILHRIHDGLIGERKATIEEFRKQESSAKEEIVNLLADVRAYKDNREKKSDALFNKKGCAKADKLKAVAALQQYLGGAPVDLALHKAALEDGELSKYYKKALTLRSNLAKLAGSAASAGAADGAPPAASAAASAAAGSAAGGAANASGSRGRRL
jgi:hypothetical protein